MGKIAEAYVEIGSKTKEFDAGLDQSKSKLTEWASGMQKLVAAFVIAKAGQEFLQFLGSAVKASSDLAESANKAGVAFGTAFPKLAKFADEMASKFGIVKTEIYDMTAGLGFMLTNAGLTKDAAAGIAIQLARVATDVSSIQNLPVGDILTKMRAGISGEAEPLRPLGVNVQEENVKKQARAMGFYNDTLTDQQKILARIALIINGLNYAQGDLANTAAEYANMTRKAAGDWENMKARIGDEIKPAMLELIKAGYDMRDAFKEAFGTEPMQAFREYLQAITGDIKAVREGEGGGWWARLAYHAATGNVGGMYSDMTAPNAIPKVVPPPHVPTAAEKAQAAMEKTAKQIEAINREHFVLAPGRQLMANLAEGSMGLKQGLAQAMTGNLGGIIGGFLKGGLPGAMMGAARGGLLNKLVPDQGVGPLSSHVMATADFARFAQEQASGHAQQQLEAAKAAAENTKETVGQVKQVVEGVKELIRRFTAGPAGTVLKGPT